MVVFVMVATAAIMVVFMMVRMRFFLGADDHFPFHLPGQFCQFRNQPVRVFCRQPQLFGGEGNDRFFHRPMGIEEFLNLSRAVGAVQILDPIYLSGHRNPSYFVLTYEHLFICFSISHICFLVNRKKPRNPGSGAIFQVNSGLIFWRKIRMKKNMVALPLASSAMGYASHTRFTLPERLRRYAAGSSTTS